MSASRSDEEKQRNFERFMLGRLIIDAAFKDPQMRAMVLQLSADPDLVGRDKRRLHPLTKELRLIEQRGATAWPPRFLGSGG